MYKILGLFYLLIMSYSGLSFAQSQKTGVLNADSSLCSVREIGVNENVCVRCTSRIFGACASSHSRVCADYGGTGSGAGCSPNNCGKGSWCCKAKVCTYVPPPRPDRIRPLEKPPEIKFDRHGRIKYIR